jgi:tellurite resistance protein
MADDQSQARAVEWFYLEHFGFSKAPPQTDAEVVRNMALSLVSVASGDGELSREESQWILGYFAAKGYPLAVIEEMSRIPRAGIAALPELMQLGILRNSGRILVYDAIRASSVDGYTDGERAAVRSAARALGIDDASVAEFEQLVADEHALKVRRIKLLMPTGHPNLDPKYQP